LWSIGAKGGENVVHKDRIQRGRSPKGEKMLFTKIELKGGEEQRGELIKEGDQLKF
jgi:hypothetical protein